MDTYTRLLNLPRIRLYIQILNQNPAIKITNLLLALWPFKCHKKLNILKYMTFRDSSIMYIIATFEVHFIDLIRPMT